MGLGLRNHVAHALVRCARRFLGVDGERVGEAAIQDWIVRQFLREEVGKAYNIGFREKSKLVRRMQQACEAIPNASGWPAHIVIATEIFLTPPDVQGVVVECGCWKGASTANLSMACELTGRQLLVFDSFEGLPEEKLQVHRYPHKKVYGYYERGMYAATMAEVKENIGQYGHLASCTLIPGFFEDTMPQLEQPVVLAWLDVDLLSSLTDCIRYVWPRLVDMGYIYTDDSNDMEVVRIWFDNGWWEKEFGKTAPGYVGAGAGIPLSVRGSSLGYAQKVENCEESYGRIHWLRYPRENVGVGADVQTSCQMAQREGTANE